MKAELEVDNAEKQITKSIEVSDADVYRKTPQKNLCQVEGSLLASMFSGRREDGPQVTTMASSCAKKYSNSKESHSIAESSRRSNEKFQ